MDKHSSESDGNGTRPDLGWGYVGEVLGSRPARAQNSAQGCEKQAHAETELWDTFGLFRQHYVRQQLSSGFRLAVLHVGL